MRRFFMWSWTLICISAALVALFGTESKASDKQTQTTVRVRVIKDVDLIELKVKNLLVFDSKGTRLNLVKTNEWAVVTFAKSSDEGQPHLRVTSPSLKKAFTETDLYFPVDFYGSEIMTEGKALPSPLRVAFLHGQMSGISTIKMSDYLLGVLHKEMSGKWPKEAMKAQAIATRSYSLAQMSARASDDFDLEGSVLDQDFEWVTPQQRKSLEIQNWQQALDETRDMILVGSNGETLKAYYHSDCGGETTVPDLVWGPKGEFQSVKDPACSERKSNHWHLEIPKSVIEKKIASEETGGRQLKFDWVKSTFDRRVTWVEWTAQFTGSAHDAWQLISGQNFRRLLGFDLLKSTRFKATDKGDRIFFEGQGFGHGVGLCQWGSKSWAEQGWNVWKILNHYYPKAKIAYWRDPILAKAGKPGLGEKEGLRAVNSGKALSRSSDKSSIQLD